MGNAVADLSSKQDHPRHKLSTLNVVPTLGGKGADAQLICVSFHCVGNVIVRSAQKESVAAGDTELTEDLRTQCNSGCCEEYVVTSSHMM